jgi:hypothetical protein
VTAQQIIDEVNRLPANDKAEVLRAILHSTMRKRQLSGEELEALAERMLAAEDPAEADRLEKEIIAGFYGR